MKLKYFKSVELDGFDQPKLAISISQLAALLPGKFSNKDRYKQFDFAKWEINQYSKKGVKRRYWILKEDADRIEKDPKIFICRVGEFISTQHIVVPKQESDKEQVVHQYVNKTQIQITLIVCTTILIISALAMIMFK